VVQFVNAENSRGNLLDMDSILLQPLGGQAPSEGVQANHNQKQAGNPDGTNTATDQRGMPNSPFIVGTHPRRENPLDEAKHKAENDTKEKRDRWTFCLAIFNAIIAVVVAVFTGLLVCIGWRGVRAAMHTLLVLRRRAQSMQAQLIEARDANLSTKNFAIGNLAKLEAQASAMAAQVDLICARLTLRTKP